MKNKLFTITLAALSIVLAGSCEKNDDITPDTAKVLPNGALPGVFSVSATKKVYFSKGNLYYDGSFFFFENYQWEFPTSWNNKHIGHFCWSKNASVAISGKYNESTTRVSDVFFTNAEAETASKTFSVNRATGRYRTLSKEEWKYLFTRREDASNKYGYATLQLDGTKGTVYGIILLPDYFDDPKTNKGNSAFVPAPSTGWKQNIYDKDGWNAMESAGAVFLPAAGYYNSREVKNVNIQGSYWSSSTYSDNSMYFVLFKETYLKYECTSACVQGYSVRLVTDAN